MDILGWETRLVNAGMEIDVEQLGKAVPTAMGNSLIILTFSHTVDFQKNSLPDWQSAKACSPMV